MMGEHICAGGGPGADAAPAPAGGGGGGLAIANLLPSAKSIQERLGGVVDTFMPIGKSVHDKIGAIPPVDTAIASKLTTKLCNRPLNPHE